MIKIGITGSIASGKSTAAKLISGKKYPFFSADKTVKNLYRDRIFMKKIKKEFNKRIGKYYSPFSVKKLLDEIQGMIEVNAHLNGDLEKLEKLLAKTSIYWA